VTHLQRIATAALLTLAACSQSRVGPAAADFLYLWTGSADSTQPDFLAVLDVSEDPVRYGRLVTTLAVPGHRNGPHHTEHELPADRRLFASGYLSGRTCRLSAQCPDGSPPPCRARVVSPAPAPAANSVAVLYFENLSRDTADAYLADGLTEEVTSRLGDLAQLRCPVSAVTDGSGAVMPHGRSQWK
jgi:hypothetical protein